MANVWGYWDCKYCGTAHIRGDNKVCPNCGRSVDKDIHYYLDKDNLVTVEKEKENMQADWICDFCDTQNKATDTVCKNCGSSRFEAKHDYFNRTDKKPASPVRPEEDDDEEEPAQPVKINKKLIATLASIGALIIALCIWFGHKVDVTTTITGFEWEYTVHTQQFTECHESGWSLPSGARLTRTADEVHHYDQVFDHYETRSRQVSHQECVGYDTEYRDLGNGQFESYSVPVYETVYETEYYDEPVYRDVPVYQTKYYYDIDRWVTDQDLVTSEKDHFPYWHASRPATDVSNPVYGQKRESGTDEEYYIYMANGDKNEIDRTSWLSYELGDEITYQTTWLKAQRLKK